ncbi:MAG: CoA-binding protein, partial [Alphaproteobacteria bacterium]
MRCRIENIPCVVFYRTYKSDKLFETLCRKVNNYSMKVNKKQVGRFFEVKRLAMAGVSKDPNKFGNRIFNDLQKNGYTILPVNPKYESIDGVLCYKNVSDLPDDVENLLIMTPKQATDTTLREAISKGIKNIWVQQHSETETTIK